jgi:hypothetical protein
MKNIVTPITISATQTTTATTQILAIDGFFAVHAANGAPHKPSLPAHHFIHTCTG